MGIGDWGLGVWGVAQTPKPKTQTPNPQPQNIIKILNKNYTKK